MQFRSRIISQADKARALSERGLTLVEIVVVLIILSIVGTFLIGKVLGAGDSAKMDITKMKMTEVKSAIEQFQLRYNTLPGSIDSLIKCTEETGADCIPVLKEEQLKDAWGTFLIYERQGDGRSYRIRTLGADRRDGGEGVNYDAFVTGP